MVTTSSSKAERLDALDARPNSLSARAQPANGRRYDVSPPQVQVQLVDHPIARHALAILRNKRTPSRELQLYSNQLLLVLTMEATRTIPDREEVVETEAGAHVGRVLGKPVAFLSLARHGLGLAHNVADFIPNVAIGAISFDLAQSGQRVEPRLHLPHAPALNDARVILFDPVVGSGMTASAGLNLLQRSGATDIVLISFVMSAAGVKRVQGAASKLAIHTAAIDEELDPKRGPIPGIGDFARRLYA